MANCGQVCPYNTLDGCKVKEYNAICPLTNMAKPVTEYRMTNADRIRAMTDEELAKTFETDFATCPPNAGEDKWCDKDADCKQCWLGWLKQPAK